MSATTSRKCAAVWGNPRFSKGATSLRAVLRTGQANPACAMTARASGRPRAHVLQIPARRARLELGSVSTCSLVSRRLRRYAGNLNAKDPNTITTGPASINPGTVKPYGMTFPVITLRDCVNVLYRPGTNTVVRWFEGTSGDVVLGPCPRRRCWGVGRAVGL